MVKQLTQKEEFTEMLALSSYAFNKKKTGHEIDAFFELCAHSTNWGVKEDGVVSSQVMAIPYEVTVGSHSMTMYGIGNVATYPENRGQGHIRHLFSAMLDDLFEKKTALSYLAPFSYPFYRKYGYEQTIDRQIFRFQSQAMNLVKNERKGQLVRTSWAATPYQSEIKDCYQKTLAKNNGALIRSDWDWHYVNDRYRERLFALCLDEKKQLQGYLIYELGASDFHVIELAAQTDWARRKLWSFVASHGASFQTFIYPAALNEDLSDIFVDPSLYTRSTEPYMMSRIVHFQEFLSHYPWNIAKTDKEISLILGVENDCCELNNGHWQVLLRNGKATCQRVFDKADFTADIQTWTQVLTGYRSLENAIQVGLISSTAANKRTAAVAPVFPALTQPMLYNYF